MVAAEELFFVRQVTGRTHEVRKRVANSTEGEHANAPDERPTMLMKTLGGLQFWTDIHHTGGWRVQEHALTGHFRLLDLQNMRHRSGTLDQCRQQLDGLVDAGRVRPNHGSVVVVLHGLVRATSSVRRLGKYLEREGGWASVDFEYASTRRSIADHARSLGRLIDSLGGEVRQINFVAHSMGNIVIRRLVGDQIRESGKCDPRFHRMVMIGPPNHGSKVARVMRYTGLFHPIAGPASRELGIGWEEVEPTLATPPFEFGIIAGGTFSNPLLSNFLLEGKDDWTVSVEETKLAGARDFLVRPLWHATMMRNRATMEAALNFLRHGYFVSESLRSPIE